MIDESQALHHLAGGNCCEDLDPAGWYAYSNAGPYTGRRSCVRCGAVLSSSTAHGHPGRTGGVGARPRRKLMREHTVALNRKAYHEYHIEEHIEAGIALTGTE